MTNITIGPIAVEVLADVYQATTVPPSRSQRDRKEQQAEALLAIFKADDGLLFAEDLA